MIITPDHWIAGAQRQLIPGGSAMPVRRCLVIHFTSGASAQSSVDFWRTPAAKGASAHVVIDRDGAVIQCRPFDRTCGHAGVSKWREPKTGRVFVGLNSCGIGIELANAGNDEVLAKRWSELPPLTAVHRNESTAETWERFPALQFDACLKVSKALVSRYHLDDITGHDCIAPRRKDDPGPAFPMLSLREACGFSGLPEVMW